MKLRPNQFIAYLGDAEGKPIVIVDINDAGELRKGELNVEGDQLAAVKKMAVNLAHAVVLVDKLRQPT